MIYLDNAATTMPKPPEVYAAVMEAMQTCASLGRSGHAAAQRASELAFQCREAAAEMFDAAPEQIVFTGNATHSLNLAIKSLIGPGDEVLISGFEHNAVLRPLTHLGAKITVAGKTLYAPDRLLQEMEAALIKQPKAVVCTHVSNVFGYIQPIEQVAALCSRHHVPLIVDAAQSAGCLPVSMRQLQAAFIAMPGHKGLLGPQGTGLLICGQTPRPLMEGGTGSRSVSPRMPEYLPDCAEPGTHNVPGIAGLLAGISYVQQQTLPAISAHETALISLLRQSLQQLPDMRLFSGPFSLQTGVLSFQPGNMDCETFAAQMAELGFAVRAGLHCAPLAHSSAGTLERGTVRVSVSPFNTEDDIRAFAEQAAAVMAHAKY